MIKTISSVESSPSPQAAMGGDHASRLLLHDELHARPSIYFRPPAEVWHIALLDAADCPVREALHGFDEARISSDGKHGIAALGEGRIKWERHTEFTSLTFVVEHEAAPTAPSAPPEAFTRLAAKMGGTRVALIHVAAVVKEEAAILLEGPSFADCAASRVGGGDASVWSSFRIAEDGFTKMLLVNEALNPYRCGRMVRRLLEIETYRMMALLGLPLARAASPKAADYEARLDRLLKGITAGSRSDEKLLGEVTGLASEVISFIVATRDRFSATAAYAELVAERISELREERLEGHQRIGVLIQRRFRPAVRTCATAAKRLDTISTRMGQASDLLRTTVQVQLERQNATLLESMEKRAHAQQRIQEAVEGLSVIAITYYLVGLFKIGLETAIEENLLPKDAKVATLIALPVAAFAVWRAVRNLRRVFENISNHAAISRRSDAA